MKPISIKYKMLKESYRRVTEEELWKSEASSMH